MIRKALGPALTAVAAVLALAIGGCSSGVSTAPGGVTVAQLITSMKSGFSTANSVRMSGSGLFSGQHVTLNISMFRSGDESGSIHVGTLPVTLVSVGGTDYVLVTKAFFNYLHTTQGVSSSACAKMCGKYVKLPTNSFSSKFNFNLLTSQVKQKVPVPSTVPNLTVTTYQGQPAYELSDSQGRKVFVAKNGTHYLLGLVEPGKFTLNFSDWNAVPTISAPPASQVVNG